MIIKAYLRISFDRIFKPIKSLFVNHDFFRTFSVRLSHSLTIRSNNRHIRGNCTTIDLLKNVKSPNSYQYNLLCSFVSTN